MHELTALFRDDQIGLAQQIEMVGNARQAHDKVLADFAHIKLSVAQQFENTASRGIIERAEKLGHDI